MVYSNITPQERQMLLENIAERLGNEAQLLADWESLKDLRKRYDNYLLDIKTINQEISILESNRDAVSQTVVNIVKNFVDTDTYNLAYLHEVYVNANNNIFELIDKKRRLTNDYRNNA